MVAIAATIGSILQGWDNATITGTYQLPNYISVCSKV